MDWNVMAKRRAVGCITQAWQSLEKSETVPIVGTNDTLTWTSGAEAIIPGTSLTVPQLIARTMNLQETIAEARAGSTVSQSILGISYLHGNDVDQDYTEAFRWLTLAAEKGASRSLYHLGLMYEQGLYGPIDLEQAFDCFHRAAMREEVSAYIHVARMLRHGSGTVADQNAARQWYVRILDEVKRGWTFEYAEEARAFVLE